MNKWTKTSLKNSHQFTIGNAARLTGQKGHNYLLEIAKFLKNKGLDFVIMIAGSGEEEDRIKKFIEKEKLSKQVKLLGFVENMDDFMAQIDILVSTATYEGFGYVLAEAMLAEKAVIAFDTSSNPEIIEDGKSGILVPPFDIEKFGNAIAYLMKDQKKRMQMGQYGKESVKRRFNQKTQLALIKSYIFE